MTRIFAVLAAFATVLMAATLVLGLSLGDVANPEKIEVQRWATVHRLSGVAAALVVVLVNSIAVTYFVGTSRWCREVVETYSLSPELMRRSQLLKRRTFPWAVISMLVVVGVVALGGAADPAASLQLQPVAGMTWANWHLIGAMAGLAVIVLSFVLQRSNIEANHEVITDIVEQVKRIRDQRGLD